jgi:hypothetical protein
MGKKCKGKITYLMSYLMASFVLKFNSHLLDTKVGFRVVIACLELDNLREGREGKGSHISTFVHHLIRANVE